MRIVDTNQPANAAVPVERTDAARISNPAGGDGTSAKVPQTADSVQLSGLSGRVSDSLQADVASRARKVSQVAAAVQSGTYHVDPKAVSRAIVDHAISMSGDIDRDGDER